MNNMVEENQETENAPVAEEDQVTEAEKESPEEQSPAKPGNPKANWYILQAYAGYEMRVEKTIREKLKIAKLEEFVEEIFIPTEEIVRTKGGKKRKINQKYFPGYVLIQMELTPEIWHLLMNVERVSGFVGGSAKEPLPLDEKELEGIRVQISDGFQQAAEEEEYHVGQKVMITEGPFNNFNGVIDEISRERKKLKVLVSIFGRPTPVEVEFDKVKNV